MRKTQHNINASKRLTHWLNHCSLFILSLLSLFAVFWAQPSYANILSEGDHSGSQNFIPLVIGTLVICFSSLIVGIPWQKIRHKKEEIREKMHEKFLDDIFLWFFFSLCIALLPLMVESLVTENCGLIDILRSPDILIIITALVGSSVGDLVIIGRKEKLDHRYTCVVGSGVLCAMFAGQLYGQISDRSCVDLIDNAVSASTMAVLAFSCVYTVCAKAMGAAYGVDDSDSGENIQSNPHNNGSGPNNNGASANATVMDGQKIVTSTASADSTTSNTQTTSNSQLPEGAVPKSNITSPQDAQET